MYVYMCTYIYIWFRLATEESLKALIKSCSPQRHGKYSRFLIPQFVLSATSTRLPLQAASFGCHCVPSAFGLGRGDP